MKRRALLQAAGASALVWAWPAQASLAADFETAIIRDDFVRVRELLQRGLDPNTLDSHGNPGVVRAMRNDSWRVAQVLLQAPGLRVNDANPQGETPLMLACIKGQLDLVRELLSLGARINQPGWAPLHYAASADAPHSLAIAQLLLDEHAYIDAESPNGSTPLMLAAQYGSQAMVELLLNAGADVQLRNQLGLTAVDFARRSDRDYMVRILQTAYDATRRTKATW